METKSNHLKNSYKKMPKAAVCGLGCKVNAYETAQMQEQFIRAGFRIVAFDEVADIYAVNTCAVTNIAEAKSRKLLRRAKGLNKNAIVVAVGCMADISKQEALASLGVDLVVPADKKDKLSEMVSALCDLKGIAFQKDDERNAAAFDMNTRAQTKTRAYVKLQDGCDRFCSYCIIPYARGHVCSKNIDDAVAEIKALTKLNYKEFVLTGINLSAYGEDLGFDGGQYLLNTIERLESIDGDFRIRLGSLEPALIKDAFIERLIKCERVCPHFHLSLQSGCDETLARMNRHYTTAQYADKVNLLRTFYDQPAITTDVIVGFPGEDEREFCNTLEFVKSMGFAKTHVFPYSAKKGTAASELTGSVSKQEKERRALMLREAEKACAKNYREQLKGYKTCVLWEEIIERNGQNYIVGHNERYCLMAQPINDKEPKSINTIKGRFCEGRMEDFVYADSV